MCKKHRDLEKALKPCWTFNTVQVGEGTGRGGEGGGEEVRQKGPCYNISPVTSTNVGISPSNFLTFSFNTFITLV